MATNFDGLVLDNVEITPDELGSGTFGKVFKANYFGAACAAKKFHIAWIQSACRGLDSKGNLKHPTAFLNKCQECAKLRHPNVVQFMGICYERDGGFVVPLIVMEKMKGNLQMFLGHKANICMGDKLSILLDVSQGLMYLHSQTPAVAHGGFTSKNVLLTSHLQAKITCDAQVLNLLKLKCQKMPQIGSEISDFLPHNIRFGSHSIDSSQSLDVFCYGGVILHTITQQWPKPSAPFHVQANGSKPSEVEQRSQYIEKVKQHDYNLQELVEKCLGDNPKQRPTITTVNQKVKSIIGSDHELKPAATSASPQTETFFEQEHKITKYNEFERKLKEKDEIIKQKDQEIEEKTAEIERKYEEIDRTKKECEEKIQQLLKDKSEKSTRKSLQNDQTHRESINKPSFLPKDGKKGLKSEEAPQENTTVGASHDKTAPSRGNPSFAQQQMPAIKECNVENIPKFVYANNLMSVTVNIRGNRGQPIPNCENDIRAFIEQASITKVVAINVEFKNGQYDVSFIIREAGDYTLNIFVADKIITDSSCRVHCLQYLQEATDYLVGKRMIKSLRSANATSCYFNAVLQVLNQTNGISELKSKAEKKRTYSLQYQNKEISLDTAVPCDVTGVNEDSVLHTLNLFLEEVESDENIVINPNYVLHRLKENCNQHQRFEPHTQEDSHELLRYLLYELKKEEIMLIKKSVYESFQVTEDFSSNPNIDESIKTIIKGLLRAASKVITPIETVFGGTKLNTVICRECQTPSQTLEPFFDISLGIPDVTEEDAVYSSWKQPKYNTSSESYWQNRSVAKSRGKANSNVNQSSRFGYNKSGVQSQLEDGKSTSVGHSETQEIDKRSFQSLLKANKFDYQPLKKAEYSNDLEESLADHTDIDNMDEDNKFICNTCSEQNSCAADSDGYKLCLVTKQVLICQLPPTLILHYKRFIIGSYTVRKDSRHVSFPPVLNMAPYCSNKCLEKFSDANGNILYGLYGVIEHIGELLQSGHYVAYIRRRPEWQQSVQSTNPWVYNRKAAHDGMWFYTSDLTVRKCTRGFEDVKRCNPYMLFYELLPQISAGTTV